MRMIRRTLLVLMAALATAGPAAAASYDELMRDAGAAFEAGDFKLAAAKLDEAQTQRPYSLYLWRNRILARTLAGETEAALGLASKAAGRGLTLTLDGHPGFDALRKAPGFEAVALTMEENATPLGVATRVAGGDRDDLLPEAIAVRKGRMLIGSARTGEILELKDGALTPVATLDGGVFDLEIGKRSIWAAANNQLAFQDRSAPPRASLVRFDARTGATLERYDVAGDALFGDIEVAADGRVYVSDSASARLFILEPGAPSLREFAADPRFVNPQGVALDKRRGLLFMADYLAGLFAIDQDSGEAHLIANIADAHLGGIDGLYLHEGDLIAVQNGATPQRIVRIALSPDGRSATALAVLQRNLAEWAEPTHGVVTKGAFHYLATTNWPAYDDDGRLLEGSTLAPLTVLSSPLR